MLKSKFLINLCNSVKSYYKISIYYYKLILERSRVYLIKKRYNLFINFANLTTRGQNMHKSELKKMAAQFKKNVATGNITFSQQAPQADPEALRNLREQQSNSPLVKTLEINLEPGQLVKVFNNSKAFMDKNRPQMHNESSFYILLIDYNTRDWIRCYENEVLMIVEKTPKKFWNPGLHETVLLDCLVAHYNSQIVLLEYRFLSYLQRI